MITQHVGKTIGNGQKAFMAFIRHKNPLMCPQGALARWLLARYHVGLGGKRVPSVNELGSVRLFPGKATGDGEGCRGCDKTGGEG